MGFPVDEGRRPTLRSGWAYTTSAFVAAILGASCAGDSARASVANGPTAAATPSADPTVREGAPGDIARQVQRLHDAAADKCEFGKRPELLLPTVDLADLQEWYLNYEGKTCEIEGTHQPSTGSGGGQIVGHGGDVALTMGLKACEGRQVRAIIRVPETCHVGPCLKPYVPLIHITALGDAPDAGTPAAAPARHWELDRLDEIDENHQPDIDATKVAAERGTCSYGKPGSAPDEEVSLANLEHCRRKFAHQ